jgi:signal transduction histidine kinase
MKKSGTASMEHEELLSSIDIQDWNLKAFAGEIYENIGQILSLTKIQISTLNPDRKEEARQIVEQSDLLLAKAIKDLRNLARQFTPTEIINKGFATSVCQELERLNMADMCTSDYSIKGNSFRLEEIRELLLFSILNHYIYKAIYEEKARHMSVLITYREKSISLRMNWMPVSTPECSLAGIKITHDVLKRARLINARIRTGESEAGSILHILVKRISS